MGKMIHYTVCCLFLERSVLPTFPIEQTFLSSALEPKSLMEQNILGIFFQNMLADSM